MTHPQTRGSVIPWWIIALLVALIITAVIGLSGCASTDYEWRQTFQPAPKPWLYVEVEDVDRTCREVQRAEGTQSPDGRILGCATWSPKGCIVYLSPKAPHWIREHEEKHCLGWAHGA